MPCMGVPGRLGRYAVRRRLGSGGFATVWLAYDEQLDAEVAVKVLSDTWIDDDAVRQRFLEEGRFLRRVESEHVVQVHDVGELDDGRPFLVLTYADRGTLAERIRKEPLDLDTTVSVVGQIGRGLQALHRRGLLHRDVKPANVLFRSTDDGERAVLSDLGLGKSLDEVSRITIPGGTLSYVAPEQALGERPDARADQYSLAAVAYAALTGRSPHQVSGFGATGRIEAPPRPSELGAAVPGRIEDAILRALQPDREKRWPDVVAFTEELYAGLADTTKSMEPVPALPAAAEDERGRRQDKLITLVGTTTDESTGPLAGADQPTTSGRSGRLSRSRRSGRSGRSDGSDRSGESARSGHPDESDRSGDSGGLDQLGRAEGLGRPGRSGGVGGLEGSGALVGGGGTKRPRRRRTPWVLATLLALLAGAGGGFLGQRQLAERELVRVGDAAIAIEVPRTWTQNLAGPTWQPPSGGRAEPGWRASVYSTPNSEGIFVGILPGGLPNALPEHTECRQSGSLDQSQVDSRPAATRSYSFCSGAPFVLERLIQVTPDKLIWVLIRADEQDLLDEVANSVVHGAMVS